MSSQIDKIALRKHFRLARRSLTERDQQVAAENLCHVIRSKGLLSPKQTVSLYLANDGELSCEPLIHWCWQQSINVALPVIHPFHSKSLAFFLYKEDSKMVENKYGILEPKLDVTKIVPLQQLSAIFLPLVAFDNTGNRLGMGGGYYDRTFAALGTMSVANNFLFGVAHDCQEAKRLTTDSWDIGLNKIITPSRVICPDN